MCLKNCKIIDFLGIYWDKKEFFSGISFLYVQYVKKVSICLWKLSNKTDLLMPPILRKKISSPTVFRPWSADRKTSYALQLAEKHFTALVIFQNSFLSGLKFYFWLLIFISYQLTVVNVQYNIYREKQFKKMN
jgi:hypothetical protein